MEGREGGGKRGGDTFPDVSATKSGRQVALCHQSVKSDGGEQELVRLAGLRDLGEEREGCSGDCEGGLLESLPASPLSLVLVFARGPAVSSLCLGRLLHEWFVWMRLCVYVFVCV